MSEVPLYQPIISFASGDKYTSTTLDGESHDWWLQGLLANNATHHPGMATAGIQGYFAHKKRPPPRTIGPWAYSYFRVLGGRCFL